MRDLHKFYQLILHCFKIIFCLQFDNIGKKNSKKNKETRLSFTNSVQYISNKYNLPLFGKMLFFRGGPKLRKYFLV